MTAGKSDSESARFVAVLLPESKRLLGDQGYYGPMLQGLSDGLLEKNCYMRPVQCLHEYQKEHFLRTPPGFYKGVVFIGLLFK